tara:strand:- start:1294 stop:2148 length:855 start_codon:yes stop_codon:yes gene_type:complete
MGIKISEILLIFFFLVSIFLSVFTYYAYQKKDKQTEKTALLVSTIVCWVVSLILLIYILFWRKEKTDSYSQPIDTQPTNDIDPRKDESIRFALTHLETAIREISNLTKIDEEHDNYIRNLIEKIRNNQKLDNTEKKKLAIDYFRYHEYFIKDRSDNIIATPYGKKLAEVITGYEDIDLDFLLRKFGKFKRNFENNTDKLTRNDLPQDVEIFETEVKNLNQNPEYPVNALNRPKKYLPGEISLLDYYVNLQNERIDARKREEAILSKNRRFKESGSALFNPYAIY